MDLEGRAKRILSASDELKQSAERRLQERLTKLKDDELRASEQRREAERLTNERVVDAARERLSRVGVIELFEALIEQRPNWSYSINVRDSLSGRPDIAASLRTETVHSDGIGEAPGSDSHYGVSIILTGGVLKEKVLVNNIEVGRNSLDELVEMALVHPQGLQLDNTWLDGHWRSS
ncbi:MAG: hypothetical protein HYS86_02920 [Candidatus Chisholmbacteria bacterium]|nr:hypothetical protein [Candidatus Chisholmbacteria bacterium]